MAAAQVVSFGVVSLMAVAVVKTGTHQLRPAERRNYVAVLKAVRWWMAPACLVNLAVVVTVGSWLMRVPLLDFSWWKFLSGQGGNVALGQTAFSGPGWAVVSLALPVGILLVIPTLALYEEWMFRQGRERRSVVGKFGTQLKFGLLHSLFAGVPLAFGLALTISGLYFLAVYQHHFRKAADGDPLAPATRSSRNAAGVAAAMKSAAAHAVNNYLVVALLLVYLVAER